MDLFSKVKVEKRVFLLLPLFFITLLSYQYTIPWYMSCIKVPVQYKNNKSDVDNPRSTSVFYTDETNLINYKGRIGLASLQPLLQNVSISPNLKNASGHPLILIWTKFFSSDASTILKGFNTSSCDQVCEYTEDRNIFEKAEAVLFHGPSIGRHDDPVSLNMSRPPGQVWIYNNLEAPTGFGNIPSHLRGLFNWTMTYRRDADIPFPYGQIIETPPISRELWEEIENKRMFAIMRKTKLVVWAVSHCWTESRREDLVKGLQRYIPLDIVGSCGNAGYCRETDLGRNGIDYDTCFAKFETDYKFYLAFENSICQDYVTEKFFNPMRHDIVPIVYGGADLNEVGAPKGSYIDIRDFNNSQQLAEYLIELDKDVEKYAKYFEYKRNYRVHSRSDVSWCRMCEKLYRQRELSYSQWYPDILEWYENEYHDRAQTGAKMCVGRDEIRFNN